MNVSAFAFSMITPSSSTVNGRRKTVSPSRVGMPVERVVCEPGFFAEGMEERPQKDHGVVVGLCRNAALFFRMEKSPAQRGLNLGHLLDRRIGLLHELDEPIDPTLRLRDVTLAQGTTTRELFPLRRDVVEQDRGHARARTQFVDRLHKFFGSALRLEIVLKLFQRDLGLCARALKGGVTLLAQSARRDALDLDAEVLDHVGTVHGDATVPPLAATFLDFEGHAKNSGVTS
jgi:hypothetical protein